MFKHVFYEVNKYLISTSDQYICETVMTWEWSIVTWAAELGIGNHGLGASASTKRHLCVICVMPLRPGGGHSLPFNKFSLKAISQFCPQPTNAILLLSSSSSLSPLPSTFNANANQWMAMTYMYNMQIYIQILSHRLSDKILKLYPCTSR